MKLPPRVGVNPRKRDKRDKDYAPALRAKCAYTELVKKCMLGLALVTLFAFPITLIGIWIHVT